MLGGAFCCQNARTSQSEAHGSSISIGPGVSEAHGLSVSVGQIGRAHV